MATPRVHAIPYKKCRYVDGRCEKCGKPKGWRISFWNRRQGQKADCRGHR